MLKNLLIVYSSKYGQAEKVARRIGEVARSPRMDARVYEVTAVPPDALEHSECAIVVGPVHFSRHPKPLCDFVRLHRDRLTEMHAAFVSVSLAASHAEGLADAEANVEAFLEETGWRPSRTELVAGALAYSHYGFFKRWLVRRIAKSKGLDTDTSRDYEYTDWHAVDAFARHFIAPRGSVRIA